MSEHPSRLQLADDLLRRFASAVRGAQLYSPTHPLVARTLGALAETIDQITADQSSITIGIVGEELVVGDTPMPKASETMGELMRRLHAGGIERIAIERGVTSDELGTFVRALAAKDLRAEGQFDLDLPHIRVGRITLQKRVSTGSAANMAAIRAQYNEAVGIAAAIYESAQVEGQPDPTAARSMVDTLAATVAQNRTALLALTALKNYDNYTFTHMVNVSILTMAQARGLGIDGPMLREFGLAALMHDIGKVRTPTEILNKPEKLTDAEFEIMKRHTVDGASILRRTPEMPALAPVVAFEHHMRLDGSGYPPVKRTALNLGTLLCAVSDVYDAMRSQRKYQKAFPTDRILAVLKSKDGGLFDQNLVRRFVQVVGIYPAGNLVRLNTHEVAVVLHVYAPDPFRPQVRVLFDTAGNRLERPYDLNLWEMDKEGERASSVLCPLDPAEFQIDPLIYL